MVAGLHLSNFQITVSRSGNTAVLISGPKLYFDLLSNAFPNFRFSPVWPDQFNRYDWGVYINNIGEKEREDVKMLLELFQNTVCIDDSLSQTFALSYHYLPGYNTGRTEIGELVYQAKYQRNVAMANQLASEFCNFISCHPTYRASQLIIATPPSDPNKPFDLPKFIVEYICEKLEMLNGSHLVRKVKNTKPMKDASPEDKFENMLGAFAILDDTAVRKKLVIIVDDLYYSGTTLMELASTLNDAGATVQGLVATKATRR